MGPCGNKKCGFNHNEYENHCEIFNEGIEQGCCEAFLPEEILAPISDVISRHEWRFRCENLEKEFEQARKEININNYLMLPAITGDRDYWRNQCKERTKALMEAYEEISNFKTK